MLFLRIRQRVLGALLLEPSRWWYRSDLAKHPGVAPTSRQKELPALTGAGLLVVRRGGNRAYDRADPEKLLVPELSGILAKTAGLVDVLRDALTPARARITTAFVHGSIASGTERATSEGDPLMIGEAGLAELSPHLRKAEQRLGRPVNATVFTLDEFRRRAARKHHFLRSVLDLPRLFVIGTTRDLQRARVAGPR